MTANDGILRVKDIDTLRSLCEQRLGGRVAKGEKVVFGEGPADAAVMLIGEAPGAREAKTGRPFVGNAGRLLTGLLEETGLRREDVYIANVLKTHPPGNRTPTRGMMAEQLPFLRRQIQLIAPRLLVLLGATALQGLVDPKARITRLRGTWVTVEGIAAFVTYHPAAVFHDDSRRELLHRDFQALAERLNGA
jgi:DNA polymerase